MSMPARSASDEEIRLAFERIAVEAGRAVYELFKSGCAVDHKADKSPVTEADHAAEAIILRGLEKVLPTVPVVAEEAVSAGRIPGELGEQFLLVDPLDGTREFVSGKGDFTINIALVRGEAPAIGVVYAPVRGWLFSGRPGLAEKVEVDGDFNPAKRQPVRVRDIGPNPDVVASHSHRDAETDRLIAEMNAGNIVSVGSSLKFCMVAAGEADIYPRCGRTMQWDTAAGDAVLRAAGGLTSTMDGAPLRYGFREGDGEDRLANPHFIARGKQPVAA
jgi:3'(2'), 5'-bisphosphate nucleotidase